MMNYVKNIFFPVIKGRSRYSIIFVIVLYVIVALILFYPLFDSNPLFRRYIGNDLVRYFFPWVNSLLGSIHLKTLTLDHWNFYASSGSPNLIEGTQYYLPTESLIVFYRAAGNFLSLFAIQNFMLIHVVVGALGFYLLLRSRNTSHFLSFFGGLIFILTSLICLIWVFPLAISLLPWIILALEKYFSKGLVFWLVLAAFLFFQQLAASQQFFIYSLAFIPLYLWATGQLASINVKRFAYFLGLTLLFSSIILIPLFEFNHLVARGNYIDPAYVGSGANQIKNVFDLIIFNYGSGYAGLYLGTVSLVLICSFFSRAKKQDYKMLVSAVVLFIYGLASTFIQPIAHLIPGLGSMRELARVNGVIVIFLILLLIKSFQNFRPDFPKIFRLATIVSATVVAGFFILNLNADGVLLSLFFLGLFLLTIYLYDKKLITNTILIGTVAILIFLDISRTFFPQRDSFLLSYEVGIDKNLAKTDWFQQQNLTPRVDRTFRTTTDNFINFDYNKFLITKDYSAGSFSAAGGEKTPAILKTYDNFLSAAEINPNLLKVANIKTNESDKSYYPRAYTVECYQVSGNEAAMLKDLTDPGFSGLDRVVVYKRLPTVKEINSTTKCESQLMPVNYTNIDDQIFFDPINLQKPALLFISDNYYPGWQATVNGQEAEVLRANYTFKAIVLPAGKNKVEMKYKPKTIQIGAWISITTLFFSLVAIIYDIKKKRCKPYASKKTRN